MAIDSPDKVLVCLKLGGGLVHLIWSLYCHIAKDIKHLDQKHF